MPKPDLSEIERLCHEKNIKMTDQRRLIARVLSESDDHPTVEEVYARAARLDDRMSLATVYRTLSLFEQENILKSHNFDGRARYEAWENYEQDHHHHLIDLRSGRIIEFASEELEELKIKIANDLGYKLIDHRLELYGIPNDQPAKK